MLLYSVVVLGLRSRVVLFAGLEVLTLYDCYCYNAVIPYLNLAEPYHTRNAEP